MSFTLLNFSLLRFVFTFGSVFVVACAAFPPGHRDQPCESSRRT